MSPRDRADDTSGNQKKRYEAPQLVSYGDIAAVTQTVGGMGMMDGGSGMGNNKTQP